MHPTVKCTFDAEENVLRLILKEFVEQTNVPQKDWKGEVVIYALKVRPTLSTYSSVLLTWPLLFSLGDLVQNKISKISLARWSRVLG